jgi:hypothetical protein
MTISEAKVIVRLLISTYERICEAEINDDKIEWENATNTMEGLKQRAREALKIDRACVICGRDEQFNQTYRFENGDEVQLCTMHYLD